MRARVGLALGGPIVDAGAGAATVLGQPTWGPNGLLRDLELRLGLPPIAEASSARLSRWIARIKSVADEDAFYTRSLAVDELGTAAALLEWRDALVEAGWDGAPIPGGGDRLGVLAVLERHDEVRMPPGGADRLVRVERALGSVPPGSRIYESIALAEDLALWPRRWQAIFRLLEAHGTSIARRHVELPRGAAGTDLSLLQARLRGDKGATSIRGDASVLFLRADTPGDLAELTAALLANSRRSGGIDAVVRCRDAEPLESALARHGLPPQGCSSESVWRPAMQVLPLAIELAFEPRDPFRVLELLTLPVGPFRGSFGARLARAVARQPGIGGQEWNRQKAEAIRRLHEHRVRLEREQGRSEEEAEQRAGAVVEDRLRLLTAWLEGRGADPRGAARTDLLAVTERVRGWQKGHLRGDDADVYGAAYAQTAAFAEALANDTRELLSQEDARQLLDRFARTEQAQTLSTEAAGRLAHVNHPAGLLAPCDRVYLWSFVADVARKPPRPPWNDGERAALERAAITFPDPAALLRAEAEHWRRAVLAARERVVFIVPRTIKGTATAPHPLWDEICARLALDDAGVARITRDARRLLSGADSNRLVRVSASAPLRLPEARPAWRVPSDVLGTETGTRQTSVTALEKIATCPLAWVLEHQAGLRSGAMSRVATGPLLSGGLSHRLVEELYEAGAFDLPEHEFLARSFELFERLLSTEAATLLLPGASIERLQLTRQVRGAMRALYRFLERSAFRIAGVEEVVTIDSALGPLHGRLDLRLADAEGRPAVLDLKWGASSYRERIAQGRAVQLAAYSRALAENNGRVPPPAAYFALASGQVLSADARMHPTRPIDGPSLETTWRRVEATAKAVIEAHHRGTVHVSGTRRALPLLDALGVADADRDRHFDAAPDAACAYCDYDALCGRKWEALS